MSTIKEVFEAGKGILQLTPTFGLDVNSGIRFPCWEFCCCHMRTTVLYSPLAVKRAVLREEYTLWSC